MNTGMNTTLPRRTIILAICAVLAMGSALAEDLIFNSQEFMPFSYTANGAVAGPGADIIRLVCKEAGLGFKLNIFPWARSQEDVKTGKAHALFLIGWNADRATWLNQSPPIVDTEYGFFVKAADPLVLTDMSQLKDYSVAVYGPSNTATTLEKVQATVPGMTIDVSPDDESAFRKANGDRTKAVFSNRDVGLAMIAKLGLKNLRYAGKQSGLKYYIGFSKEFVSKATLDAFNAAYRKLYKAGEIQKILKSYNMTPSALE